MMFYHLKTHWVANAFLFYIESFFKIIRLNCEQFVNISKKKQTSLGSLTACANL